MLLFTTMIWMVLMAVQAENLNRIPPDLEVPAMVDARPAAGKRVRGTLREYEGTDVHHALYLPTDWEEGKKFPVIVEYAGNGGYRNRLGDVSRGTVEGSRLGYGVTGGKGFIWLCLPYVNVVEKRNQEKWWGDVAATVDYCKKAVKRVCAEYGGDRERVVLAGFSRGAIACNFIGLHDDEVASLWRAFLVHSHYDGVRKWPYPGSDRASARRRLERLKGRPQWVSHEGSVEEAKRYLEATGVEGDFTFEALPYPNHTEGWVMRDVPMRAKVRGWLKRVTR